MYKYSILKQAGEQVLFQIEGVPALDLSSLISSRSIAAVSTHALKILSNAQNFNAGSSTVFVRY